MSALSQVDRVLSVVLPQSYFFFIVTNNTREKEEEGETRAKMEDAQI